MSVNKEKPVKKFPPEHYITRFGTFIALEVVLVSLWLYLLIAVGFSSLFSSSAAAAAAASQRHAAVNMLGYTESLLDPVSIIIWVVATIGILVLILFLIKPKGEGGKGTIVSCYLRAFKKVSIILLTAGWIITIISIWIMKAVVPWSNINP
ncbi:MAG: hypothetical protein M1269_05060 [Chloroflexi bacterium]|nr:hypothetical protein [Chloroflexota bacterium]